MMMEGRVLRKDRKQSRTLKMNRSKTQSVPGTSKRINMGSMRMIIAKMKR